MVGFLFILLSSTAFGFSNAYWKKAIQGYSFLQIIFVRGLFTTCFFAVCAGLDREYGLFQNWLGVSPDFTWQQWSLSFGLCLFSAFGLYFFVQAMQSKAVALVAPISSINLFGLLTTVFILGESWGLPSSFALVFVCLGLYFLFQKEFQFHGIRALGSAIRGGLLSSFFLGSLLHLVQISGGLVRRIALHTLARRKCHFTSRDIFAFSTAGLAKNSLATHLGISAMRHSRFHFFAFGFFQSNDDPNYFCQQISTRFDLAFWPNPLQRKA